ncbi:hypothetical protein [Paraherbaspirillum soli]|uniref:Uncharacterized protein n=1 Tax=Paraherbaspirillum soli TaxID=631222 RepID=A0ABW0MBT6_9BURK
MNNTHDRIGGRLEKPTAGFGKPANPGPVMLARSVRLQVLQLRRPDLGPLATVFRGVLEFSETSNKKGAIGSFFIAGNARLMLFKQCSVTSNSFVQRLA